MLASRLAALPLVNAMFRNSLSGNIGSATLDSMMPKSTSTRPPPNRPASTYGLLQPMV